MKESYPIEVAEYDVANKIIGKPSLSWWDKINLKHRNRMINDVKYRYWSCNHKFGLELTHSLEEAIAIDRKICTDY